MILNDGNDSGTGNDDKCNRVRIGRTISIAGCMVVTGRGNAANGDGNGTDSGYDDDYSSVRTGCN